MDGTTRRNAAVAGLVGGALWLIAHLGMALAEIEYKDPARQSFLPDWVTPFGLLAGAVAIAYFTQFSGLLASRRVGVGRVAILLGAAVSLVPLWPFIILGPFLAAVGFFGVAAADWISGRRSAGIALHAFALPASLPSGFAFHAVGLDGGLGWLLFGTVLALGIARRAVESLPVNEEAGRPGKQVPA